MNKVLCEQGGGRFAMWVTKSGFQAKVLFEMNLEGWAGRSLLG